MRKIAKKTVIVFIALLVIAGMGFIVMFAYNNRPVDVTEKNHSFVEPKVYKNGDYRQVINIAEEDIDEDYYVKWDNIDIPESEKKELKEQEERAGISRYPCQEGFIEKINDNEVILAFGSVQKWDPSALRQTFKFTDDTMYLDVKQGQVIKSYDDINTLSPKDFKVDDCVSITFKKLSTGEFEFVAIEHFDEAFHEPGVCDELFPDSKEVTKKNLENLLETILRSIGINR